MTDGLPVEQVGRCTIVDLDGSAEGADLEGQAAEADVVVVFDVIRAFTTTVASVAAGATSIHCVADLDHARRLAGGLAGAVLMGEERGARPAGFDLGNSPLDLVGWDLRGRPVVQRTSNGTRGLVRVAAAPVVLAAAAVNASATGRWVRSRSPRSVLLVGTGLTSEDRACARFVAEVVDGARPDAAALATAITATAAEHLAFWSRERDPSELAAFHADVAACARVDTSAVVLRGRTDPAGTPVAAPGGAEPEPVVVLEVAR